MEFLRSTGVKRTLVAIMPPRFQWYKPDIWIPAPLDKSQAATDPYPQDLLEQGVLFLRSAVRAVRKVSAIWKSQAHGENGAASRDRRMLLQHRHSFPVHS